jgi:hypothetical protein
MRFNSFTRSIATLSFSLLFVLAAFARPALAHSDDALPDSKTAVSKLSVSPTSLSFNVNLDKVTYETKHFSITNKGTLPMTVTVGASTGTDASDYTIVFPPILSHGAGGTLTLPAGIAQEVDVSFSPTGADKKLDASISIANISTGSTTGPTSVTVELKGKATQKKPTPTATATSTATATVTATPTPSMTPTPTPTPGPAWLELRPMSLSLYGLAAGSPGEVVAAGGYIPGSGVSEAAYACLLCTPALPDWPLSGGWEGKPPMLSPQSFPAYAPGPGDSALLYVAGGDDGSGPVATLTEMIWPISFSTLTAMPTARSAPAGAFNAGLFYVMGGNTGSGLTGVLEVYNTSSNSWTSAAPMITPRSDLGADVIDGIIYAAGGIDASSQTLATLEAYNPATNSWSTEAPMLTPRADLAVVALNGLLYAIGGRGADGNPLASVEAYNPATNSWTPQLPMPTARWGLAALVAPASEMDTSLATGIWAIGGAIDAAGDTATNAVEVFVPAVGTGLARSTSK